MTNEVFKRLRRVENGLSNMWRLTCENADTFNKFADRVNGKLKNHENRIQKCEKKLFWNRFITGILLVDFIERKLEEGKKSGERKFGDDENS